MNLITPSAARDGTIGVFSTAKRFRQPLVAVVGVAAALSLARDASAQWTLHRASVNSEGTQANATSAFAAISEDGSHVAFVSWATNLVTPDTNGSPDIFVHDRLTGRTLRASESSSGTQGDAGSWNPALSADSRFVGFVSYSTNLVPGDVNGVADVFVKDLSTGATELVSVGSGGVQGDLDSDGFVALSADARFVTFTSAATNLVAGDTNGSEDVFVRDRVQGTITRVSVDSSGVQANGNCGPEPLISADGRFVAFVSDATNLVAGDTNQNPDVFVHDRLTAQTTRVNVTSSGAQCDSYTNLPTMSADGRYVGFVTNSNLLVPEDTDAGLFDLFLHDRLTGQTSLISTDTPGFDFANVGGPSISSDGRRFAYQFQVTSGIGHDQVLFQDLDTGVKTLLTPYGVNGGSVLSAIAGSASVVAFGSTLSKLVPHDSNSAADIIVASFAGEPTTIASYCTAGTTSHGCTATISGVGTPRNLAPSGFTITVSGVEGGAAGMIFYGMVGAQSVPFGSGSSVLCVRPPLIRAQLLQAGGTPGACDGTFVLDWNTFTTSHSELHGWGRLGGYTVWAQAWFRDPLAPGGSHLSNALWFTVAR